jgi:hypothetical protein
MSTSHRRPAPKHRVMASTMLATAAATVGIGLAAAAPAGADTGNILKLPKPPSTSRLETKAAPSVRIDQRVAVIKAVVKRVLTSLPRPCAEPNAPAPEAAS